MVARNRISQLTDSLVAETKDVFVAAHAYVGKWRETRGPTTMTPDGLGISKDVAQGDFFSYAMPMATHGVKPHGHEPPTRVRHQAYSSVNDDPTTTASELRGDLERGRLFLFTAASELAAGDLAESKLTFVTQADVTNPDVVKTRYISDPRVAVNERVFSDNHPACVIPRNQHVARRLLYCKRRYPGAPVLISKRDVKSAFKLAPLAVCGLAYMGCRFARFIGIYLALFFGWRPSPANWGGRFQRWPCSILLPTASPMSSRRP